MYEAKYPKNKKCEGEINLKMTFFPLKLTVKPSEFLQNCGLYIFQEIWPRTFIIISAKNIL